MTHPSRQFKTTLSPISRFWRRAMTSSLSWMALIGSFSGGVWLLGGAIAPPIAHAYTGRVTITLDREPDESYQTLIRRAESAARAAAQRSFDSDLLMSDVVVTIIAESQNLAAPVLSLAVNRTQWRSIPDPQQWATYFPSSRSLLGLDRVVPSGTAPTPTSAPTVTSTPISPAATPSLQPATAAPSAIEPAATSDNPVQINLPAAPTGQLGLPRSILR